MDIDTHNTCQDSDGAQDKESVPSAVVDLRDGSAPTNPGMPEGGWPASCLRPPTQLFDPHEPELVRLMDTASFPAGLFKATEALVVLRSLGLQSTLSWPGFVCVCVCV